MQQQTVFVVGAGASTELGDTSAFPIGRQLANRIRLQLVSEIPLMKNPSGPRGPVMEALMSSGGGLSGETISAAEKIQLAIVGHDSIDDLLADWRQSPEMLRVAKIAIAFVISEAEKRSPLARIIGRDTISTQTELSALRESWLGILLRNLKAGRSLDQFINALYETAFIVFNYDRTVEKMIYHWIIAITDLGEGKAAEVVQTMKIIHPHGSLGSLRLGEQDDGFGGNIHLAQQASAIKTYAEGDTATRAQASDIQLQCELAKKLIFLGFSFHPANNKLLIRDKVAPNGNVWATAYELGRGRRGDAQKAFFPGWGSAPDQMVDLTCSKLMEALADDFAN